MAFEFHSDAAGSAVVTAAGGEAWGPFVLCGTWTSANGETGIVSKEIAEAKGSRAAIDALVRAGLWTDLSRDGHRMEYGPSQDWPLPIWRYGDTPCAPGRFVEVVPEPDA